MKYLTLSACAVALTLAACGGGGGDAGTPVTTPSNNTSGTLALSLTDSPACGFDHVYVTVQKVRVNASADAAEDAAGWTDLTVGPTQRFDLLALQNGVLASLGQVPLTAGHYSQLRLVLAENGGATPLANSVVPTGGSEVALKTPSGQTSGLKLNANIDIAANQMADFVIDFDACKSVVTAGNSGQYLLKPVVSVVPNLTSGVSGYVDASVAYGGTHISLQQGGVVLKATAPDSSGKFVLAPAAPGSYDLVIQSPARATMVVTGVPVTASTMTAVSTSVAPLSPAPAIDGQAVGSIMVDGAPNTAAIAATQKLASGGLITVAETMSDSTTGAFKLGLPAAPPWVAAYAAAPASLVFAADVTAGLSYSFSASLNGTVKVVGPLAITAGGTLTVNFGF
ncbi:hypothetical protein J2X20_003433 [Pelomonas saccharophila]|uniref:DUF4382 domain-containing protein n=1 Tax=Roseateles saccharophilus TaxID=304 RepID=A0ABU1YPI4_ROSSA|nr:DUF4382 domain-containing protein [Roseateles saccharophilus]MDR7270775.1 hypothetical protein [Roseateles saccharophilus]